MTSPQRIFTILLLTHVGNFVVSQTQNVQWTNDLSDLLTNTGLREDLPVGTLLGTLSITGIPTNIIHVSYSSNSSYFIVNEQTGEVRLNAPLSYRDMDTFTVAFFARDNSQAFSTQRVVTVNVRGVNHPPQFDVPVYQVSVKDNVPIGTTFYNLIYFSDIDTGPNGTVTLSCNPSTSEEYSACSTFAITTQKAIGKDYSYLGNVSTVTMLNYLNRTSYVLPLLVKDEGNPPLSATATLIINIESQFDNQPVFLNSPIILNINESAPSTTDLGYVQARTGSINRTMPLGLKITDDKFHWFYLENTTYDVVANIYSARIRTFGNITRASLLSDQYSFDVTASELYSNGQESQVASETTVQVNVQDVNTYSPTFSLPNYVISVIEGLGVDAVIPGLTMAVVDLDQGDNAYFVLQVTSVTPSPVPAIFIVEPDAAQGSASVYLIVNKPEYLAYDDPNKRQYIVQITASETKTKELYSGTTTVTINILSRSNNPPVFTRSEYLASLVDNRPVGTIVTDQIQAVDPDSGDAGRITYSILSGNNNLYFAIDPSLATITLARNVTYSATGMYVVLTILARDGTGLNATATLRIQIIDSSHQGPVFNPPFIDTIVLENQVDLRPPIQFVASPLQRDKVVSYMIISGDQSLFNLQTNKSVNPNDQPTGVITMTHGVDYNDTPDRKGVFQVIVQASSTAPNPLYTNLTINVYVQDTNNHAPVFSPTVYSTEISEITPPETSLLTVNATDMDAPNSNNSKVHYIIDSGSRDNFVVDYTTGVIKIASHPILSIDRFGDQYNITVLAIDGGSPPMTGTATVYIHVKDSVYRPPSFSNTLYTFYVVENTTVNTMVGTTPAMSPDRRALLSYSILPDTVIAKDKNGQPVISSSGNFNYNTSFAVNNKNGSITVNGPLSYDYFNRIDFQVQAVVTNPDINGTIPPAITSVTIFIVPLGPSSDTVVFLDPSSEFLYIPIYNTLPVGTLLYQLSAYYAATRRPIARYNYTAAPPDTVGYISVGYQNGTITLAQYLASINLKLPMNLTYVVTASADPPSTASEKATVVINVRDINADVPAFNQRIYNFTIYNNISKGDFVGKIEATLPGSSQNAMLYTLEGFKYDAFYLNNRTGEIYVNDPDKVNSMVLFALSGKASSGMSPSSGNSPTTQVVVYINVIHSYNMNNPQFSQTDYTFYTLDKTPVSTTIGIVNAIDPDIYHVSTITYTTSGNGTDFFQVNPVTGSIQTKKPLMYNPYPYILTVTATSSGLPPQTSSVTVKVFVENVTESGIGFYVPTSDGATYYAYVNYSNYFILRALGYSTRTGAYLNYSIYTPVYSDPGKFVIDPVTGNLTTNGILTYDPNNWYQIVCITLTDNVQPLLNLTRCIRVVFVSDQLPSFALCSGLNSTLQANVLENTDIGTFVTTVKACSLDKPPNDTDMRYTITGGNNPSGCYNGVTPFVIDPLTGNITTNAKLLWNCTNDIQLNVTVTTSDGRRAMNGSTIQLVIHVLPTDSNGPSFDSNQTGTCRGVGTDVTDGILDFTTPGTVFIHMQAGDCDAPQFGHHNYSIDSGKIKFVVPGDTSSSQDVPGAFAIDPITGDVSTNLSNYRPYSHGYFQMTIVATDDKSRTATAMLTVFIVREGQRIKYVFGKTTNELRPVDMDFINGVNNFLSQYSIKPVAYDPKLGTHVDQNAYYYFNMTDMCFQVIRKDTTPQVLSAKDAINLFPPICNTPSDWIIKSLAQNYSVQNYQNGPQLCYVKTTTHWWSGYWFLWWLLIALALFIFVMALILNILACCFWPMYTRGYLKSRPYIVLDEPPTTSPVSDFEWQESMHRIN